MFNCHSGCRFKRFSHGVSAEAKQFLLVYFGSIQALIGGHWRQRIQSSALPNGYDFMVTPRDHGKGFRSGK